MKLNTQSADQAMELLDCVWEASPVEMMTSNGITIPNKRAIIREDKKLVLGVVGDKYRPCTKNY